MNDSNTTLDDLKEANAALHKEVNKEHDRATWWMVLFWATWGLVAAVFAFRILVKLSARM